MDEGIDKQSAKGKVCIINIFPGMKPEYLEANAQDLQAVILIGFATGCTPEYINPAISALTKKGVVCFLVSDNVKDNHGIYGLKYHSHESAIKAGIIPIQRVNINGIEELYNEVQKAIDEGKQGKELALTIFEEFSYKETDEFPHPDIRDRSRRLREQVLSMVAGGGFEPPTSGL